MKVQGEKQRKVIEEQREKQLAVIDKKVIKIR